jgi:hypothetical protein
MINFIVGKCHADMSYSEVIRFVISKLKGKRKQWVKLSKEKRKEVLRLIIQSHKNNKEVYAIFS